MDFFDKINQAMDDFGIGGKENTEAEKGLLDKASEVASFIITISDPDERKKAIVDCLSQAYRMGVKNGRGED